MKFTGPTIWNFSKEKIIFFKTKAHTHPQGQGPRFRLVKVFPSKAKQSRTKEREDLKRYE